MQPSSFESLARSMATARTRRGLLAAFAGGLAVGLFGVGTRRAEARWVPLTPDPQQCCARCEEDRKACWESCSFLGTIWDPNCPKPDSDRAPICEAACINAHPNNRGQAQEACDIGRRLASLSR
jgi:hypothetical protein